MSPDSARNSPAGPESNTNGKNGSEPQRTRVAKIRRRLRQFFSRPAVEITVGLLVLTSVLMTLLEIYYESLGQSQNAPEFQWVIFCNSVITWIFIVELSLRAWASTSLKRFFAEYWLDIFAILPQIRWLRSARALKLLRLVRLLRLLGVVSRLRQRYPRMFRHGLAEYLVVGGVVFYTVLIGTVSLVYFENSERRNAIAAGVETPYSLDDAFWFSIYSMFAGEPTPDAPDTLGGKLVALVIMFMGLTVFAMFTGTVSALMIQKFRSEDLNMNFEDMEDHVIICGWSTKTEIIIAEYRASQAYRDTPIVVITQMELEQISIPKTLGGQVYFIHDDFTKISALTRAGIEHAKTCIILSDTSGGRTEQDADARAILAALTVEKINKDVYSCAELVNRSYSTHLELGHVNDYVVSGEYSAYMLAQAAMNRGLMGVLGELLTYQHGNEFYRCPIPKNWHGRSFHEMLMELKQHQDSILVAVQPVGGKMIVNPREHTFCEGDEVVVIGTGPVC